MMVPITITGWVQKDLETQTSKKGSTYTRFDVAVTKGFGDMATKNYYECLAYSPIAERMVKAKVASGSLIQLIGDLEIKDYERKDGTKTKIPKVTVYDWCYLLKAKASEEN